MPLKFCWCLYKQKGSGTSKIWSIGQLWTQGKNTDLNISITRGQRGTKFCIVLYFYTYLCIKFQRVQAKNAPLSRKYYLQIKIPTFFLVMVVRSMSPYARRTSSSTILQSSLDIPEEAIFSPARLEIRAHCHGRAVMEIWPSIKHFTSCTMPV